MEALNHLFENNLINWIVLIGLLGFAWSKFVPSVLESRKDGIETALKEAAKARQEGEAFLAEQRAKVADADARSAQIIEEARQLAIEMELQMKAQMAADLADMQKKIEVQIAGERQLAITELRAAAARAAIKLTEQMLPSMMNAEAKSKLLSQFMEQLDSNSQQGTKVSAGHLESIH